MNNCIVVRTLAMNWWRVTWSIIKCLVGRRWYLIKKRLTKWRNLTSQVWDIFMNEILEWSNTICHDWRVVNPLILFKPTITIYTFYISIVLYPLGLVLIGFKPRSRLKRHYYVKPANFLYPDETVSWFSVACTCLTYYVNKLYQVIQGSGKLFTALLRQCLSRDVIAICRYIPRVNASPSFVAMVPQVHLLKWLLPLYVCSIGMFV